MLPSVMQEFLTKRDATLFHDLTEDCGHNEDRPPIPPALRHLSELVCLEEYRQEDCADAQCAA